jgi:T5SS/PEP-CTERM-associated repeat protein
MKMRLILPALLLTFVLLSQLKSQTIVSVPFDQLEASQYNIGLNGVQWSQSSTLSNFSKLYTTGWLNGKFDTNKPGNYYGPGAQGILKYASNNAPPSIYGVNGFDTNANVQHLLDNHHRVSGLYLLTTIFTNGYRATVTVTNASGTVITTNIGAAPAYTYVNQTADWSAMSSGQFWSNMLAGTGDTNFAPVSTNANGFWSTTNQPTFLWAYNKGVLQIPTNTPPPMIPNLTDDTLRDVAAQVNYPDDYGFTLKGYQNRDDAEQNDIQGDNGNGLVLYYQEFWWANYLRPYVYLIPTGSNIQTAGMDSNAPYQFTDYSQLIAFSADFLCHSSNAAHLPGYYNPGLTSVDFPEFRPGSSVLMGPSGALDVSGSMIIDNAATLTVQGSLSVTNEMFYVGKETPNNTMVISNGGVVTNNNAVIGSSATSINNSALITGSGSTWFLYGDLIVGEFGSANGMTISNGGQVTNGLSVYGSVIGYGAGSHGNSVLVSGTNSNGVASTWTCVNDLTVGWSGSSNSLVIDQGGAVTSYIGIIGDNTNARGNHVLVDGAGSYWSNSNVLLVGVSGSGNSLLITNGGQVMAINSDIGVNAGSTANIVTVSGMGSVWTNSGDLTVGYGGSSNALTVSEGAQVFSSNSYIGRDPGSASNMVMITGNGSLWSNSGSIFIGDNGTGVGGSGNLVVRDGAMVQAATINIIRGSVFAGSTNALGSSDLVLGGADESALLRLETNLTISAALTWASNGVIALSQGSHTMTLGGMTNSAGTNDGSNVFQFLKTELSNATNTLINYTSLSGFTTNSFSVSGISGYSFSTNGNKVSAYLSTSANVTVSNSISINGTLTVNSLTVDPSGTLMGTGTLSLTGGNLSVNGTLAPGNSPGTFFVSGGNLLMGTTSVWDQQIYSSSVYDQVVVTGSAILNGVMNITTFGSGGLQFGQKYNFLTASGGISGAFSSIVAPEGFRGRLLLSGNNTQANILIAPASYTQLAANRNQSNVATALNSFIPYTSGDQQVVSTSLDSLTASQYNQAFNAIMPTFYQQIATIAFNNANAQNMQLVQRLWGLRVAEGGGFSMSGLADNMPLLEGQGDGKGVLDSKKDILRPGLDNHWGMFVDGNGIFAQANSGNMLPGYNSQSGGVTTGLTYKWNENVGTGIYCGYQGTYTKSGADGSGLGTGSRLIDNAVRFGVFGTYGQKDGKGLFVNALAGGGYHNFQATRVIQYAGMNRTANSAPGAGELDTMLAAGYDIKKGKFTFGPTASLQYTYLGVNSLNETGAQSLSFNSGGWNSSSMLSSVGAHAAYSWVAHKNILVVPQVNLSWQHEFMQNPYAISGNLGGTSPTFSNWSATPIRDYLYTGVGFTVEFSKRWNTSFFYNAAAGNSDLVSQNIFWSAGVKF